MAEKVVVRDIDTEVCLDKEALLNKIRELNGNPEEEDGEEE